MGDELRADDPGEDPARHDRGQRAWPSFRRDAVGDGEAEGEEEDEVVYISREASHFNLAQYLYEFTILALPIRNTYDCQDNPNPPCNREVLDFLEKEAQELEARKSANVWDALKDLNKDN